MTVQGAAEARASIVLRPRQGCSLPRPAEAVPVLVRAAAVEAHSNSASDGQSADNPGGTAGTGGNGGGGGGSEGGGGGGGGGAVSGGGGGSFSASTPSIATDGFQSGDGYVTITASVVPTDAFQVNYASNLQAGDSFVNISNTGSSAGNLCANIYVFDPSEEIVSCAVRISLAVAQSLIFCNSVKEKPTASCILGD